MLTAVPRLALPDVVQLVSTALLFNIPVVFPSLAATECVSDPPRRNMNAGVQPFTVEDSIQMTRLERLDSSAVDGNPFVAMSPKHRRFVFMTSRGDIARDVNVYSLVLVDVEDVLDFVNADSGVRDTAVRQTKLAQFSTTSVFGAIRGLTWTGDGEHLAFLGGEAEALTQVNLINVVNQKIRRITSHPTAVGSFDIHLDEGVLVYSAPEKLVWGDRHRNGYAVEGDGMMHTLALKQPDLSVPRRWKRYVLNTQSGKKMDVAGGYIGLMPEPISLSPDGRWAFTFDPVDDISREQLKEYRSLGPDGASQARRLVLIDVKTGQSEDLVDAPMGSGRRKAIWSPDSLRLIIVNTHLPLDNMSIDEVERRRNTSSVVELDLRTRKLSRIVDVPSEWFGRGIWDGNVLADGSVVVAERLFTGERGSWRTFREHGDSWVETGKAQGDYRASRQKKVTLKIKQNLNVPPDVWAIDDTTGNEALITDLNPIFRQRSLGWACTYAWSDDAGRLWRGGLLLPPHYRLKKRYPMVIQTHGFNPGKFLVDGHRSGRGGAYAARPIVNKDIVVLQMMDGREEGYGFNGPDEALNHMRAYETVVEDLDRRGIIDPRRVGLIGFSRAGMHVGYAITFSGRRFAAATIADSIAMGYFGYINRGASTHFERLIGAPFWGDTRHLWLERSPAFNQHRIRTPLRIETYGAYINDHWDTFVLLRKHKRPVEMIHIPNALHPLRRPRARYTSLQGNVDWFVFWLKGEEDPNPKKRGQYIRWRELRKFHERDCAANCLSADSRS